MKMDVDMYKRNYGGYDECDYKLTVTNEMSHNQMEELVEALSTLLLDEKIPCDIKTGTNGYTIVHANQTLTKRRIWRIARKYPDIYIRPSPIQIKIDKVLEEFKRSNLSVSVSLRYDDDTSESLQRGGSIEMPANVAKWLGNALLIASQAMECGEEKTIKVEDEEIVSE